MFTAVPLRRVFRAASRSRCIGAAIGGVTVRIALHSTSVREPLRPGVRVHAIQHCVANRAPNPGRYRILIETAPHRRRLFRPGDRYNAAREGAKHLPERAEIPQRYHYLLDWYEREYASRRSPDVDADPIMALHGLGKEIWADEDADAYVARLRQGWND